jgi:tetratricopeptide (TPR) repeat protein
MPTDHLAPKRLATVLLSATCLLGLNGKATASSAQASTTLPAEIIGADPPARPDALGLARKYYGRTSPQIENDLRAQFSRFVNWPVNFDGKSPDPARASDLTNEIAVLVSCCDARNFYLASAAAGFSLDPANSTAAGNLGAAIRTYGEDSLEAMPTSPEKTRQLKPFRDDAIALYRYALSLNFTPAFANEANALPLLVNLGNLYLDSGLPENARAAFQKVLDTSPKSWPAHEGMAAYYLAIGRRDLAEKEMQHQEYFPGSIRKAAEEEKKTEEAVAPTVTPDDDEDEMAAKLARLQKLEPATMADFIEEIDQSEANKLRYFVNHLAAEVTYQAPDIHDILQYSSLDKFSEPEPRAIFDALVERWQTHHLASLAARQAATQLEALKSLGMTVELNVDLEDVARNPEKYKDADIKAKVSGDENLAALLPQLENLEAQAKRERPDGKLDAVMQVDQLVQGGLSAFALDPGKYANPVDVFIQKFNMAQLDKKLLAYQSYVRTVSEKLRLANQDTAKRVQRETPFVEKGMKAALKQVEEQASAAKWTEDQTMSARHHVHEMFYPQLNQIASRAWLEATEFANAQYLRKLKPNLEAMYRDCFRHVMLISDPVVRRRKESELSAALSAGISLSMTYVVQAYDIAHYTEPWSCDCSIDELQEAREREQQAFDDAVEQQRQLNKVARKEFKEGGIPETSGLYKKLDAYSETFSIPPFVEGKIGIVKSSLKFKIPLKDKAHGAEAEVNLEISADHMRNKTTVTGGLEASEKIEAGDGHVGVEAKVWTKAVVTVDSDSLAVKDWDALGGASLTGSVTTGDTSVGSVNLQSMVAYETSVMHGSAFSGEVAAIVTASDLTEQLAKKDGGEKHTEKFTLWNGKYILE